MKRCFTSGEHSSSDNTLMPEIFASSPFPPLEGFRHGHQQSSQFHFFDILGARKLIEKSVYGYLCPQLPNTKFVNSSILTILLRIAIEFNLEETSIRIVSIQKTNQIKFCDTDLFRLCRKKPSLGKNCRQPLVRLQFGRAAISALTTSFPKGTKASLISLKC